MYFAIATVDAVSTPRLGDRNYNRIEAISDVPTFKELESYNLLVR
jgi:hypothetical protein